jgi:hypothetical protein
VDGCTTAQTQQTSAFVVVKPTVRAGLVQRRQRRQPPQNTCYNTPAQMYTVKLTVCAGLVQRRQMLNGGQRAGIVQWCISPIVINNKLLIIASYIRYYYVDIMCYIITAEAVTVLPLFLDHTIK